jgi:hypothetical protein
VGVLALALLAGIQTVSAQPLTDLVMVTARPDPIEPYRFIGGRTVTVPLIVHLPTREGLTVLAELVQLSSTLAVPIAGGVDVPLGVSVPEAGATSELELSVALPAVTRETDFELRFRSFRPPDRVAQTAGRVELRVYPANLLEPVRVWAESHSIRLEDDQGSVTEVFREQRIAVALGPGPSDLTVYVEPRSAQKPSRLPRADGRPAIILAEREKATPHLVVDRTSRGTTVTVEMRLLDRLATDPLAQKIFLEAFQYAAITDDAAPTQGVVR